MDEVLDREAAAQQSIEHANEAGDGSHPYIALGPSNIRLVEVLPGQFDDPISVNIHTVDLQNQPQYTALSYVWSPKDGTIDTESPPENINVQNYPFFSFKVGVNLAAAMRHLRSSIEPTTFWIDAICIHQSSNLEKNHQVSMMAQIYSSAQQVLIWLGPGKDNSDFVMNTIVSGRIKPEHGDRFLESLELLLLRDWFGRVWVAQEMVLAAQDPDVLCVLKIVKWSSFAIAVRALQSRILSKAWSELPCITFDTRKTSAAVRSPMHDLVSNLSDDSEVPFPKLIDIMHKTAMDQNRNGGWGQSQVPQAVAVVAVRVINLANMREAGPLARFSKRLQSTVYMRATDPRDRIFALLGISSGSKHSLSADYTDSKYHVATAATVLVLREDFTSYMSLRLWNTDLWPADINPCLPRHLGLLR